MARPFARRNPALLAVFFVACAAPEARIVGPISPIPPPPFEAPARIEEADETAPAKPPEDESLARLPSFIAVPHDRPVHVAHGALHDPRVLIYMHGVCGNAEAFRMWEAAARRFGTVISLLGDDPCDEPGRFQWGLDTRAENRRISRAIDAVAAVRGAPLDATRVTLVGYSQGALRVEALAAAFPERYPRIIAIGGPRGPHLDSFRKTQAVALVVGAWDIREHLREAADKLARRRIHVRYVELPRARHGQYGPDADKVMGDVLTWLNEPW